MKPGDLCAVTGTGWIKDSKEYLRMATVRGVAVYLGETYVHPDDKWESGKYFVFMDFSHRKTPYIWLHHSGKKVNSEAAHKRAVTIMENWIKFGVSF